MKKTIIWDKVGKSRLLMLFLLYAPAQVACFGLALVVFALTPTDLLCADPELIKSTEAALVRTACSGNFLFTLMQGSIVVSLTLGMIGFLFPNKISRSLGRATNCKSDD